MNQTCTCRSWDLSRIPCPHGICCIYHKQLKLEDYISPWFHKEAYLKSYGIVMQPLRGRNTWTKSNMPPLDPPKVIKGLGRPKKLRRKDNDEPQKVGKLTRKGRKMTCSKCKQFGHNKPLVKPRHY